MGTAPESLQKEPEGGTLLRPPLLRAVRAGRMVVGLHAVVGPMPSVFHIADVGDRLSISLVFAGALVEHTLKEVCVFHQLVALVELVERLFICSTSTSSASCKAFNIILSRKALSNGRFKVRSLADYRRDFLGLIDRYAG